MRMIPGPHFREGTTVGRTSLAGVADRPPPSAAVDDFGIELVCIIKCSRTQHSLCRTQVKSYHRAIAEVRAVLVALRTCRGHARRWEDVHGGSRKKSGLRRTRETRVFGVIARIC